MKRPQQKHTLGRSEACSPANLGDHLRALWFIAWLVLGTGIALFAAVSSSARFATEAPARAYALAILVAAVFTLLMRADGRVTRHFASPHGLLRSASTATIRRARAASTALLVVFLAALAFVAVTNSEAFAGWLVRLAYGSLAVSMVCYALCGRAALPFARADWIERSAPTP